MKKGFTLIEVIISLALISLLAAGIIGLNSLSVKMGSLAGERDYEFFIARSLCEIYKSDDVLYTGEAAEISIYKYIDSIEDIEGIGELIHNKDGDFLESLREEILNHSGGLDYTLIISIKKISTDPAMECIYVEVIKNDGDNTGVLLNAAK